MLMSRQYLPLLFVCFLCQSTVFAAPSLNDVVTILDQHGKKKKFVILRKSQSLRSNVAEYIVASSNEISAEKEYLLTVFSPPDKTERKRWVENQTLVAMNPMNQVFLKTFYVGHFLKKNLQIEGQSAVMITEKSQPAFAKPSTTVQERLEETMKFVAFSKNAIKSMRHIGVVTSSIQPLSIVKTEGGDFRLANLDFLRSDFISLQNTNNSQSKYQQINQYDLAFSTFQYLFQSSPWLLSLEIKHAEAVNARKMGMGFYQEIQTILKQGSFQIQGRKNVRMYQELSSFFSGALHGDPSKRKFELPKYVSEKISRGRVGVSSCHRLTKAMAASLLQ